MMKKRTSDALTILRRRASRDPKFPEMCDEERAHLQAAMAIRRARESAGLTQAQLARKIGTTQSVISRLEDADYEGYTLKMLERIAGSLNRRLIIRIDPAASLR